VQPVGPPEDLAGQALFSLKHRLELHLGIDPASGNYRSFNSSPA
jgi:hypothetical protein